MGDTGGIFCLYAKIALRCHNLIFQIRLNHAEGADHDTNPTAHTFISVVKDISFFFIQIHGACKACLHARRFFTIATLEGKGYVALLLEHYC